MKTSRTLLAALALAAFHPAVALVPSAFAAPAAAFSPEQQSTDYANILPAEDTAAVFVMQNFFKAAALDAKTPMAKLLAHPAVRQWTQSFNPARLPDAAEISAALGLTEKDLPRLFTGNAVLAALLTKGPAKTASGDSPQVVAVQAKYDSRPLAIIEFKGAPAEYEALVDKLEAHLKTSDAKADVARERADGLLIHSYETDARFLAERPGQRTKIFHTLHRGAIIIAREKALLLDTVRSLSRGANEKPLSGRADFISVKKEMGANDGFFLANLASVMPAVNEMLAASLHEQIAANANMKPFVEPDTVVRALALENFTALYGSVKFDEKHAEARYGLTWKDRAGVASLINFGPDAVKVPEYVTAEYKGVDVSTVDFPATLDATLDLVKAVTPGGYGMAGMMLAAQPETETLLASLRKGVLDNLKPELVSLTGYASVSPADTELPGKAWVLTLRDPAAARSAIEAALAMKKDEQGNPATKPTIKEYLGVQIHTLPEFTSPVGVQVPAAEDSAEGDDPAANQSLPQTMRPSYAFVGDKCIVTLGSDGLMEGVIANMKNPGKSIVDARFDDSLGELPGTPCSVSYGDVATYLRAALNESLRNGAHRKVKLDDADLVKARAACKDLRYFWVAKSFFDKNGVYGRLVVTEQAETK